MPLPNIEGYATYKGWLVQRKGLADLRLIIAFLLTGCGATAAAPLHPQQARCDASATEIEAGVSFREIRRGDQRIWLYEPCGVEQPGLVIVPPAGSNLISGMNLSDGDRPEHLPYVREGYVVVSFDIAGAVTGESDEAYAVAAERFLLDLGGLRSAQQALNVALEEVPRIDRERIYAAGHSSAGTLTLVFAAAEDRVVAAAAYAPPTDVSAAYPDPEIPEDYRAFLRAISPIEYAEELSRKPIFLFHALEDGVVRAEETERLFNAMSPRHPRSERVTTSGSHYQPMIDEGIPRAIRWFETLTP
ncbi:MAG: prolyl oligopeptidase family serine peptidase [Myxococcota bacterium]